MGGAYGIIAGNRYEFIGEWWCVNGIRVGSEEWQEKKWGNRPTLSEALPMYYDVWRMQAKLNMELRVKPILAKKVEDMKKASAMKKLRATILPKKVQEWRRKKTQATITTPEPPPSTPINTPPAATEPEGTTIEEPLAAPKPGLEVIIDPSSITPKASPKPSWKINHESPAFPEPDPPLPAPGTSDTIQGTTEVQDQARPRIERKIYRPKVKYKDVEHLLATSEGGLYRGMTAWLRGCVGWNPPSNAYSQPVLAIC